MNIRYLFHREPTIRAISPRILLCSLFCLASLLLPLLWAQPALAQGAVGLSPFGSWVSGDGDYTQSVAWGDVDGDGDLDLAVGNWYEANRVYLNEGGVLQTTASWASDESDDTESVAWGDVDGDGDLDLVVGNSEAANRVYLNQNGVLQTTASWASDESDDTQSVAWGDVDGDGNLDLTVGNSEANRVYLNESGVLQTTASWASDESDDTESVAWGDVDGDGDLDLAVGNSEAANRVYLNEGGVLQTTASWASTESDWTESVVWGDVDGDGDLDLAVGNGSEANRIYLNEGGVLQATASWSFGESDWTESVAWGDVDGDGDLDLAVGNGGDANRVYLNESGVLQTTASWASSDSDDTVSVAWGDVDGDGDLDLAVSNGGDPHRAVPNTVYLNEGGVLQTTASWASGDNDGDSSDTTSSVAWGDVDVDGDLDLAVGNWLDANRVYLNESGVLQTMASWTSDESDTTLSVAWGDVDGDGDLDLAVGNKGANRVYLNESGVLQAIASWTSDESDWTESVAWGDVDGDGDLDLAVGNGGDPDSVVPNRGDANKVYLNESGILQTAASWTSDDSDYTQSVAWGDVDGDGDLDLAVGNWSEAKKIYLNENGVLQTTASWTSDESDDTESVAWGDVDGDGDLDLAVGNIKANRVYLNEGGALQTSASWRSDYSDYTNSVAWGDVDGDGDLDLASGNDDSVNRIYLNNSGVLQTVPSWTSSESDSTYSVAWGDVDGDGDLDLAVGNWNAANRVHLNGGPGQRLVNNAPAVTISRPITPAITSHYVPSQQITNTVIPLTYTLFDPEGDRVGLVEGAYSLNGGGQWFPATVTTDTVTTHLATGVYPTATMTNTHVYTWDTFASGFFGQSDSVVFRLVAYSHPKQGGIAGTYSYINTVPGPIQRPYASATTLPFRVRGAQVRVLKENGEPAEGAMVYRLQNGQFTGAKPISDSLGTPYLTDAQGYLQGRGAMEAGDHLVALVPVTSTHIFTASDMLDPLPEPLPFVLYHTSAVPTENGLEMHPVTAGGVQTLTVSADNPLLLFNLDLSLEWDARNDGLFMQELDNALKRASAVLYDVTNGQAALGEITVHQAKERWMGADIVLYARNDMRPRANTGGIVITATQDIFLGNDEPKLNAYLPGHIRMGPSWDPFGQSQAEMTQDWWRTLAHELAHYLFFLPDNYLGIKNNAIQQIDCKGSFMTNSYDSDYGEFLDAQSRLWQEDSCQQSVAAMTTGRSDWETITHFYPDLRAPTYGITSTLDINPALDITSALVFTGPAVLPLAVTRLVTSAQTTIENANTFPARNFDLRGEAGNIASFRQAQGYLYKTRNTETLTDDAIIALGSTGLSSDRIKVRGAEAGDRLCVLASSGTTPHIGCIDDMDTTDIAVRLSPVPNWRPDIIVSAPTTRTIDVIVTLAGSGEAEIDALYAQVFPAYGAPISTTLELVAPVVKLERTEPNIYTQQISLDEPVFEGFVRVWISDTETSGVAPAREAVSQFFLSTGWGGGGAGFSCAGNLRPWFASHRGADAPVASGDGRVTIFNVANVMDDPETASLQSIANVPNLDPWLTQVGLAYRFTSKAGAMPQREIAFQYLQRDVPLGYEETLQIYYSADDGMNWRSLSASAPDLDGNLITAPMPDNPDGIYALIAVVDIPLRGSGWDLFGYPLPETQPITQALASVASDYGVLYSYDADNPQTPWLVHDPTAPAWVNDLEHLSYGSGYWINITATKAITLQLDVTSAAINVVPPSQKSGFVDTSLTPPAVYYGVAPPNVDTDIEITATIDDIDCGTGRTHKITDGRIGFVIKVSSTCNLPIREIKFKIDTVSLTAPWNNTRANLLQIE